MNNAMQNGQMGQQEEEQVSINMNDLSTVLQLIDVVSTRGGFQGQELAGVGMLRNKLETYLRQQNPQQQGPDGEAPVGVEAGELADRVID
ncbi:MAG: hypothetical protein ACKVJK_01065 [Methylophagaceae bacterium]|jgi:hypothetical protein|tara:strand:- start:1152 stop:1421 length:270 start_codon:yes stop_codon:yes gene_type:complete